MKGKKFNRWLVIDTAPKSNNGHLRWLRVCDCGTERYICGTRLRTGASKSCGCLAKELASKRAKKHGMTNTQFHRAWQNMLDRCINKNSRSYGDYGGRGILVCDKWLVFDAFKEDMYKSYLEHVVQFGKGNTSIDREDNDDGYYKDNCRWATSKIQMMNRRVDTRNKSGYKGVSETQYGTWKAQIGRRALGTFKTKEEAAQARKEAELAEVIECPL